MAMAPGFDDAKRPICIAFIRECLEAHRATGSNKPLVIGLNGVQGVGKTTLVTALEAALEADGVPTLTCSIDDFYLTHEEQAALARAHADNALLQHRGAPGTHDVPLAKSVFASLISRQPTALPQYDKALFAGQGDRRPESCWKHVNRPQQPPIEAVILEGWSVGFQSMTAQAVEARWKAPSRTLHRHKLEHLLFINDALEEYDGLTDLLDAFIHIDSDQVEYVYGWRQEQEDSLRADKGDPSAGMTPEQVVRFVDGYVPSYELYTDRLRRGIFSDRPGRQLRIVVNRDRSIRDVTRI
ncbi:Uridine/cytidine kinase [Drechmeria coniospora]|uniref:Uridine/cytidine kinase n=1 Tax=Drechmeria coniospora TaxID=98403 RepID=A0A151GR04_DRECN|nr:Uridine/cytidine kinase [Drechmeria coniospora]KYK59520.1 Uridine/cytidine kinase [Drechmeria coniospora]ODA76239.1 hypothetical protein RJ55_08084 [Drechmeria coniospora]